MSRGKSILDSWLCLAPLVFKIEFHNEANLYNDIQCTLCILVWFSRSWRLLWLWSSTCRRKRILLCKVCTTFLPSSRALEDLGYFDSNQPTRYHKVFVRVCVLFGFGIFCFFRVTEKKKRLRAFLCKQKRNEPLCSISGLLPISDVWEA